MVEIEIGALCTQCPNGRTGEIERLVAEVQAWQYRRNTSSAHVKWIFTTQRTRRKLPRVYPKVGKES